MLKICALAVSLFSVNAHAEVEASIDDVAGVKVATARVNGARCDGSPDVIVSKIEDTESPGSPAMTMTFFYDYDDSAPAAKPAMAGMYKAGRSRGRLRTNYRASNGARKFAGFFMFASVNEMKQFASSGSKTIIRTASDCVLGEDIKSIISEVLNYKH